MNPKFNLGYECMTRGIHALVCDDPEMHIEVLKCVRRHASGDWGEVCDEDKAANEHALLHGERLLSAYTVRGVRIWIITESDRSATTILLPEEY